MGEGGSRSTKPPYWPTVVTRKKNTMKPRHPAVLLAAAAALCLSTVSRPASAEDHTMWGHTPSRNMVSEGKNPPTEWETAMTSGAGGPIMRRRASCACRRSAGERIAPARRKARAERPSAQSMRAREARY